MKPEVRRMVRRLGEEMEELDRLMAAMRQARRILVEALHPGRAWSVIPNKKKVGRLVRAALKRKRKAGD